MAQENIKVDEITAAALCARLLEALKICFDQSWFYKIADDLPVDLADFKHALHTITLNSLFFSDYKRIYEAVELLESFIIRIRRFLLPVIREKLGVSSLTGHRPDKKATQYIYCSFIAYAFPLNLDKVENLLNQLGIALFRSGVTSGSRQKTVSAYFC